MLIWSWTSVSGFSWSQVSFRECRFSFNEFT